MRIVLASDHAAFEAKRALATHLRSEGHEVLDVGTDGTDAVDYPDFGALGARAVASGRGERGVFLCGSGIGICIAANKVRGIRAAQVHDESSAEMSRRHNDANVACLGARTLPIERLLVLVDLWLATPFEGGRHAPRVGKLDALGG